MSPASQCCGYPGAPSIPFQGSRPGARSSSGRSLRSGVRAARCKSNGREPLRGAFSQRAVALDAADRGFKRGRLGNGTPGRRELDVGGALVLSVAAAT
jgi:hypothetical protein